MSGASGTAVSDQSWWEATSHGRLLLLRCPVCGDAWLPWMPHCPTCGPGTGPQMIESSGRGTLYSWVVIHYSMSAPDEVPFTVASVRLDEGAMIYGRLRPDPAREPSADAPVAAVFVERDGRTVVDFELV